jgi:hypothetical protein
MSAFGPSLQFKASTTGGRFWGEADIQKAAFNIYEYAPSRRLTAKPF